MEKMTTVTKQRKSKIFKWIFCNLCTIKMNGCSTEFLLLSCKHVFCRNCINKKNQANNATFDKFKCPYCAELSDFKIISADMKDTYLQMFDGQSLDSYREVLEVIAFQYEKCKNKINIILKATSSLASVFIALHHNVTGVEPSQENPRGIPFSYASGWKDWCAVVFYTLICIIMHAILQEYVIDKISKRFHLSKFKLARFNDTCQLAVFYAMSFLWGCDIILREGYMGRVSQLWENFPNHPMIFLHKLYFIIQLAYYFHMLPELYFQKVKKEDQQPKIIHAICSFSFIALSYLLNFQRIALMLLTLHYLSEIVAQIFNLIDIFDRDEKYKNLSLINKFTFIITRFATMVLSVLTLFYGINKNKENGSIGLIALLGVFILQGYLIFQFINNVLKAKRERRNEQLMSKKKGSKLEKSKKERKRESDLPEADQNTVTGKEQQKKIK